jgi:hypothetical protein
LGDNLQAIHYLFYHSLNAQPLEPEPNLKTASAIPIFPLVNTYLEIAATGRFFKEFHANQGNVLTNRKSGIFKRE